MALSLLCKRLLHNHSNAHIISSPFFCKSMVRGISKRSQFVKEVGVGDFLKAVGNGVEAHKDKIQSEIKDMGQLLLTRSLKLKDMGIPCKQRKVILRYAHQYRLGLWRPKVSQMQK